MSGLRRSTDCESPGSAVAQFASGVCVTVFTSQPPHRANILFAPATTNEAGSMSGVDMIATVAFPSVLTMAVQASSSPAVVYDGALVANTSLLGDPWPGTPLTGSLFRTVTDGMPADFRFLIGPGTSFVGMPSRIAAPACWLIVCWMPWTIRLGFALASNSVVRSPAAAADCCIAVA